MTGPRAVNELGGPVILGSYTQTTGNIENNLTISSKDNFLYQLLLRI